ncbi:lytic transglycosylase domain-containing protein [Marivita sp. S2033]
MGLLICGFGVSIAQANICDAAAYRAAQESGVPAEVMLAITRLETGRGSGIEPWPWTVNHAGDGTWFKSEDEARTYVFSKVKRGVSNIDIGCFQINYRWHSDGFRSLDDMFNPDLNAAHAAGFLKSLYDEFGNWTEAAGAYHSRTPKYAERYKIKFRDFRTRVASLSPPEVAKPKPAPVQSLFARSGTARPGSLFMANASGSTPFIDFNRTN